MTDSRSSLFARFCGLFSLVATLFLSSPSAVASSSAIPLTDFPSSSASTQDPPSGYFAPMRSQAELHAAKMELLAAQRLLAALETVDTPEVLKYLDELESLLQAVGGQDVREILPQLTVTLRTSRLTLLDAIEDVRTWIQLAYAVEPDAQLRLPTRFIAPPSEQFVDIDMDELRLSIAIAEHFADHA